MVTRRRGRRKRRLVAFVYLLSCGFSGAQATRLVRLREQVAFGLRSEHQGAMDVRRLDFLRWLRDHQRLPS